MTKAGTPGSAEQRIERGNDRPPPAPAQMIRNSLLEAAMRTSC
jgi:hypothetical protein